MQNTLEMIQEMEISVHANDTLQDNTCDTLLQPEHIAVVDELRCVSPSSSIQ